MLMSARQEPRDSAFPGWSLGTSLRSFVNPGGFVMDRASAVALMEEYTESVSLRRHMLAVEAAMRAYARKFGEDEEKWGIVGLLHDFDYERRPNPPDHPLQGAAILAERGYPADVIYAIKS